MHTLNWGSIPSLPFLSLIFLFILVPLSAKKYPPSPAKRSAKRCDFARPQKHLDVCWGKEMRLVATIFVVETKMFIWSLWTKMDADLLQTIRYVYLLVQRGSFVRMRQAWGQDKFGDRRNALRSFLAPLFIVHERNRRCV